MTVCAPQAVVVGAGASGLASAAMLERAGIATTVLERAGRPAASWWSRYEGLRINTVRWMSSLPGYVMERRYGDWPKREHWAAYLERYASRNRLQLRFGAEVERIDRADGNWIVRTNEDVITARCVVVATGPDHTPRIPPWPGRHDFGGRLMHSADFVNAGPFAGQDVLVVGAGNSACEIATLLAVGGAARVRIAVRTPPLILPRRVFGVSITAFAVPGAPLPDWLLDRGSRAVQRLAFGDLTGWGLPRSPRGISAQRREGYVAPIDRGFVAAVKRGAVKVVAGVDRLEGPDVVLSDGCRLRPDTVIAATGYSTGLEPLVGHLGVLRDDGRPRVAGGASPAGAPGLFFVGFHHTLVPTLPHISAEARGVAGAANGAR